MTYHKSDDSGSSANGFRCGDRARTRSGRRHRGRHHRGHRDRKERVLHTRVSEQLSEDIRRFAEDLRVPASNLVRNVLEEVFTVVDGVSDDVSELFDDLLEEAEGVRERVRRQGRPGSSARGRSRRRSTDHDVDFDRTAEADVEAEFRRDEASEALSGKGTKGEGAVGPSDRSDTPESAPDSDPEPPAATELFPDVLGWQPLVLNRDFACGRCKRVLRAGESAFLGLAASGLTETALCGRCAGRR